MRHGDVDAVILSERPTEKFEELLKKLEAQSVAPAHILVVRVGGEDRMEEWRDRHPSVEVFRIPEEDYDCAASRNMGAGFSNADYLLFMTQDAMPANRNMVRRLLESFENPLVKAAYARQIPEEHSQIPEALARQYNFPPETELHFAGDVAALGGRAYICPNLCAMYERRTFQSLGGFAVPCIMNDDMLYCGRILTLGYAVAYAAEAQVYCSGRAQDRHAFRMGFDEGALREMHPEFFSGIRGDRERKGTRRYVVRNLRKMGRSYLIPSFYRRRFLRWAGIRLGTSWRKLPEKMVRRCGMNRTFWERMCS